MKRGKKYIEAAKLIERGNLYEKEEAVALVKKAATAKFDETIEAHIRTGCDGRHADQQIRGAVVLPHGTGKKVRILVFAKDAKAEEAKAAGADFVGGDELIPKIQNEGWLDFDVVVATPDMMGVVGRSYCYNAVQWAVANGITKGTDATHFSPNATCTRGQVVTFMYRAEGEPAVGGNVGFVDVAPGSYCYEAVKWAVANGITKGTDATHFSPNATCTRGQVVTFLYRAQ